MPAGRLDIIRLVVLFFVMTSYGQSFASEPILRDWENMELLEAVYNQDAGYVETLLGRGVNANAKDYRNESALMFALKGKNDTIVEMLLANGADIRAIDISGKTVLIHGVLGGKHAFVSKILPEITQINHGDSNGYTALMYAVQEDDIPMTEILITSGADISRRSTLGTTALSHAAAFGSFYCADYLISLSADINTQAEDGSTPLHLAAWYGHNEIIGLLIDSGALIDKQDNKGNTPLMVAILADKAETVWYLLESGASLSIVNNDGFNVLSLASSSGKNEIYWLLTQYETNVPIIDNKKNSALAYAYYSRNGRLAKDLKTYSGVTPRGLYFSELWLQQGLDFNSTDIFYHSAAGIFESRFKVLMTLNYLTRIGYHQLNVPQRPNFIYRFHEKRNVISMGIYREIVLISFSEVYRIGLLPGAELAYSFAQYKGTGIKPPHGWDVIPAMNIFLHTRRFNYFAGYNYFNTNQQVIGLHRFRVGVSFRIPIYKTRQLRYKPVLL